MVQVYDGMSYVPVIFHRVVDYMTESSIHYNTIHITNKNIYKQGAFFFFLEINFIELKMVNSLNVFYSHVIFLNL